MATNVKTLSNVNQFVSPDGMIVDLYGSVAGRRHGMQILNECKILTRLRAEFSDFLIYGDPVYTLCDVLVREFPNPISKEERDQQENELIERVGGVGIQRHIVAVSMA